MVQEKRCFLLSFLVCAQDDDHMVMLQVCKTHYETTCETRFKEHEVEQDEPVCKMVTERKCKDVRGE